MIRPETAIRMASGVEFIVAMSRDDVLNRLAKLSRKRSGGWAVTVSPASFDDVSGRRWLVYPDHVAEVRAMRRLVDTAPLAEAFKWQGLRVAEVARHAGMDEAHVRQVLFGQRRTSAATALKLADVIGLDAHEVGL